MSVMLNLLAGLVVPLLAMGADVHFSAEQAPLRADPSCPVDASPPIVLRFDAQTTCARLLSQVDLPPGTTTATWSFLHARNATPGTIVVESLRMTGQDAMYAPAEGSLALQERQVRFEVGPGAADARWTWLVVGENVSAQVHVQDIRLEAAAHDAAALHVDSGARRWTGGDLVDGGRVLVHVPDAPGWQPWLRFRLEAQATPTSLVGPDGGDLLAQARWLPDERVLEVPAEAMAGPGAYRLNVRLPGSFAAEAGLAGTFLLLIVGVAGGAALSGSVLSRYAEGAGRGHTRRVRLLAILYGLLVTASVLTLWQILVEHDARIMLQSPLHPVAVAQYAALAVLSLLFLVMVLAGGAGVMRHLRRRVRQGQDAHDDLVQAQEEMQVLTAAAAHDLKSPLRAIHAYADLLQRSATDARSVEALESIKRSARRMTEGVDALLQFTRVSSTELKPRNVEATSVVRDVQDDLRDLAAARGVQVVQEGDAVLHADRALLHRALQNLVENAIKYGPPGQQVVVRVVDDDGGVRIEVRDQGDPIPEDEQQLLFEAFHRGAHGDVGGTGLGLTTVAKVAELHGGEAGVTCDGGNRFWIRLPGTGIEVPREQGVRPLARPDAAASA